MSGVYYRGEISYTEDHLQALMSAVAFLRSGGRDTTAADLADLLVRLGGPIMPAIPERNTLDG